MVRLVGSLGTVTVRAGRGLVVEAALGDAGVGRVHGRELWGEVMGRVDGVG